MAAKKQAGSPDGDAGYPKALDARVGFLLARAHLIARAEADRVLAGIGLTMRGYAALATVVSDGPLSQQKLSRRIRMDPATMVDVIDALEQSGHLLRRRNPEDRRENALLTTAKGRALFARAEKALDIAERETVRDLGAEDVRALIELLGRIAHGSGRTELASEETVTSALGGTDR